MRKTLILACALFLTTTLAMGPPATAATSTSIDVPSAPPAVDADGALEEVFRELGGVEDARFTVTRSCCSASCLLSSCTAFCCAEGQSATCRCELGSAECNCVAPAA